MKVTDSVSRILELMDVLGLKQSDIVKKTNISKACISRYLAGDRTPKQDKIDIIAHAYNINPAWLMGYDVPMHASESFSPALSLLTDDDTNEFLDIFRQLSPEHRKSLLDLATFLYHTQEDIMP